MDTHGSCLCLQMIKTEELAIFSDCDMEIDNTQCKVLQGLLVLMNDGHMNSGTIIIYTLMVSNSATCYIVKASE